MSIIGWFLARRSQVKIDVSHHTEKDGHFNNVKPLVFLMDEPKLISETKEVKKEKKERKKQPKAGLPAVTMKNFGARASVTVFKNAKNLLLAWRCRLCSSHVHGCQSCLGFIYFS